MKLVIAIIKKIRALPFEKLEMYFMKCLKGEKIKYANEGSILVAEKDQRIDQFQK